MKGLNYPVIPSLQNISKDNECDLEECLYKKNYGDVVTTKYGRHIKEVRFLYHTCVIIKTDDKDISKISTENLTVWNGRNNDSLGALLIEFFRHYAYHENLTGGISIFHAGRKGYPNYRTPVVINDPFLPINNIS